MYGIYSWAIYFESQCKRAQICENIPNPEATPYVNGNVPNPKAYTSRRQRYYMQQEMNR